jgi:endonuclease YncB( thermonuclease family)
MQMSKLIWIVGFVFAGPLFLTAQISGKVTDVYDGDSFTLLAPGNVEMKIRLHGVYCPELSRIMVSEPSSLPHPRFLAKQ